jgi:uncharacterized membrane protein YdfJ with MMPL/SSD domain
MGGNKSFANIEKILTKYENETNRLELVIHAAQLARSKKISGRAALNVLETETINLKDLDEQLMDKLQKQIQKDNKEKESKKVDSDDPPTQPKQT